MTPSTTNTAAREFYRCVECKRFGYAETPCVKCGGITTPPTLTQQQGGDQEAGDVEQQARELLAAEYERNGWGAVASRIRDDELAGEIAFHVPYALRAITAALRTKQPAASEGDKYLDQLCHVVHALTGDEGEDDPLTVLERYAANGATLTYPDDANTSKQAAGEAVAPWERISMTELAKGLRARGDDLSTDSASWLEKFAATPPRHPADEELSKSDKDYILRTQNLLLGFMLDCNAIGAKEAGVNLARSMKEKAAIQAGTP